MNQERWSAVDRYIADRVSAHDPVLDACLAASAAAGLPSIHVSTNQGKFLHLMVRALGARSVLEIGTLGGYSTTWLARALPEGGGLVTIESDPRHAEVAETNLARAGLTEVVKLRLGRALEVLPSLASEDGVPFDFVFIDADKVNTAAYFDWAIRLTRPDGMIVVDNVVRKGAVIDEASEDPNVRGVRRFYEMLASDSRVQATALQTVGSKGYDGFAVALVLHDR